MPSSNSKMTEEDKQQFEAALRLRQKGKRQQALRMLLPLQVDYPNSGPLHGMIGTIFFELKSYSHAAAAFRRTTELSTKSSVASLGLFHSLWELNQQEEAISELKRFMRVAESAEYEEIAAELGIKLVKQAA